MKIVSVELEQEEVTQLILMMESATVQLSQAAKALVLLNKLRGAASGKDQ